MDETYTYFENLSQAIDTIPTESIVSRTLFRDAQLKAILFAFAQGQELSQHTASVPAVIHILEGEADLVIGEDRFEAHPGSWARMPAKMPHSVYAKTPVRMLLLMLENA